MKKVILFTLIVSLLLCLCACGTSSKFTGTWHGETETGLDCVLTIKTDESYILQVGAHDPLTGEFEKLDDSTIILSFLGMSGTKTITCTLDGDTMHIEGYFTWKSANLQKTK